MEINIVKIGTSKGLRLSKSIFDQYNIQEKVELILEKGRIILQPIEKPRKDGETAFKEMRTANDDELLIHDVFDNENLEEWK
ncbi:MAG: AbrB/MazE/SpoVT family DNA-binding domain-containing protein [Paludibacter sp.]